MCSRCLEPLLACLELASEACKAQIHVGSSWWPQGTRVRGGSLRPLAEVLLTALLSPGIPAARAGVCKLPKLYPVPQLPGPLLRLVHRQGPVSTWGSRRPLEVREVAPPWG